MSDEEFAEIVVMSDKECAVHDRRVERHVARAHPQPLVAALEERDGEPFGAGAGEEVVGVLEVDADADDARDRRERDVPLAERRAHAELACARGGRWGGLTQKGRECEEAARGGRGRCPRARAPPRFSTTPVEPISDVASDPECGPVSPKHGMSVPSARRGRK